LYNYFFIKLQKVTFKFYTKLEIFLLKYLKFIESAI
ncbi:hypothetical protein cje23_05173, partial [Campylobacter jejuni subsp. jejuni 1997-11]